MSWSCGLLGMLVACPALFADKIILNNGEVFDGDFFGATSQQIRFVVDGQLMYFTTSEVALIQFGDAAAPAAAATCPEPAASEQQTSPPAVETPAPEPEPDPETLVRRPRTAPAPTISRRQAEPEPATEMEAEDEPVEEASLQPFTIRPGTHLLVRLDEEVDSDRHEIGQTFKALLEKPVYSGEREALPKGTEVVARLVSSRPAGGADSRTVLALDLIAIILQEQQVEISTNEVVQSGRSRTKDKVTEGLARAGARLGTILAGQTGGQTAGDAADVALEAKSIQVPAGTVLDFVLRSRVEAREGPAEDPIPPQQLISSTAR